MTNDFQAFAGGGAANVITQAQYLALSTLIANGFSAGTASSNQLNKVWRQSSIMAAVLAQFISDETGTNAVDDGTTATLLANLKLAVANLPGNGWVQPGTIISFAGATVPSGYLACPTAPATISRTTYAALFAAIGTAWGAGDGSTTFGIPYFANNYMPVQGAPGGLTHGALLAHTHNYQDTSLSGTGDGYNGAGGGHVAGVTSSTGGPDNLAAGMGVQMCVKY